MITTAEAEELLALIGSALLSMHAQEMGKMQLWTYLDMKEQAKGRAEAYARVMETIAPIVWGRVEEVRG